MAFHKVRVWPWGFMAVAAAAIGLRLAGITWGLPFSFNADEPHVINLAVSFGGGSLRPYSFKYPTLWPYLLFASYGVYFLTWSVFGLRKGVQDFIGLFAWEPGGFYLIARLLSALFSLLGALIVWKSEPESRDEPAVPWAALLMVVAPALNELGHSAKPDCLMFFLACGAWYFSLRVYREGARRWHWACGACLGLAASAQYSAAPAAIILPAAHFLGKGKPSLRWLFEGIAAAAAGFLAGSPYALIDFANFRFWLGMRSPGELAVFGELDRSAVAARVLKNMWNFAGPGSVAGLAALAGIFRLLRRERNLAFLILSPAVLYLLVLSSDPNGSWQRFLLGCYPGLALLASAGLSWWAGHGRAFRTAVLVVAALGPGLLGSVLMDREMRLPDTRHEAESWALANIPEGAVVLMDEPHACPRLPMAREQALELARLTRDLGSPRSRLYRGMAERHPGGGYRIYRLKRSPESLGTYRQHAKLSQSETPVVDVREGLSAARSLGAAYCITSSHGAGPGGEFRRFFDELHASAELLRVFEPVPGKKTGPVLRVFRLGGLRPDGGRPRKGSARSAD